MKALAWTAFILILFWTEYTLAEQVDTCLDRGGAWNYEQSKCEGAGSSP